MARLKVLSMHIPPINGAPHEIITLPGDHKKYIYGVYLWDTTHDTTVFTRHTPRLYGTKDVLQARHLYTLSIE